jgi:hypothetical protein
MQEIFEDNHAVDFATLSLLPWTNLPPNKQQHQVTMRLNCIVRRRKRHLNEIHPPGCNFDLKRFSLQTVLCLLKLIFVH